MKALTVRQPWASLIAHGYKAYEFRSWKTHYRGEVYIHAGSGIDKKYLEKFKDLNIDYPTSRILAKANIVDCLELNEELNNNIHAENPLVYGHKSLRTGYAWVLKDIKLVDIREEVKGKLSFWDYYTVEELLNEMEIIEYGWVDQKNQKHSIVDDTYSKMYKLQTPKEIKKNKIGVCWDQVEYVRKALKNHDWDIKTWFLCYYDNDKCPCHTFLTYHKDNKFYWFEHSYRLYRGIHSYETLEELLKDVREKFVSDTLDKKYDPNHLLIREYTTPHYGIGAFDFFQHCEKSEPIIL